MKAIGANNVRSDIGRSNTVRFALWGTLFAVTLSTATCTSFRFSGGGSRAPDEAMVNTGNMVVMPGKKFLRG